MSSLSVTSVPADSMTRTLLIYDSNFASGNVVRAFRMLLRNMLDVAMLVKYVANEQEAYWLLLRDFRLEPRVDQKSVTVRIPRQNRISVQPCQQIADHINAVHFRMLRANIQRRRSLR